MILNIYTDGGSRGNPGPSAIGFVIKDSCNEVIHNHGEFIGDNLTNNFAEYTAVYHAIRYSFVNFAGSQLNIFADSMLVVNQIKGIYKTKDVILAGIQKEIKSLFCHFTSVEFFHIPREKNQQADREVNKALDKLYKKRLRAI